MLTKADIERALELLLSALTGSKEVIWGNLQQYLDPSMPEWKRQNFDSIWGELHGSR